MSEKKSLRTEVVELLQLCETLGLDPAKNGMRGPEDLDAARRAITRLFIFADNLHDMGRKAKDNTLLRQATQLKTLSESVLKSLMVEGLADLFAVPEATPSLIIKP